MCETSAAKEREREREREGEKERVGSKKVSLSKKLVERGKIVTENCTSHAPHLDPFLNPSLLCLTIFCSL